MVKREEAKLLNNLTAESHYTQQPGNPVRGIFSATLDHSMALHAV